MVSNGTSSALNSEQDLASIPTAQGGLSRLAIARLKSAGVPVVPLLRRVGLTPEVIADPEERLSVRSQITLLDEAAIALQDDCLGFTLARDFDPREIGLLYYVMASSQTLGDALKRVTRYSQITNEALVVRYREGNGLIISLSYSGVPRHSDRHQIEFCMFAVLRICRVLTGQNLMPQHFWISHHRSGTNSEMARFVGTAVEFGATTDEFALNANARELPLIRDLAVRYLDDPKLHISKIAWLLGFNEVSAFTHTFKRWTGKTPSQMRTTAASSDFVQGG
jgi:Arabinose-binding domain of AraC transcription regulator, N-term/Helix-turn-helix domain